VIVRRAFTRALTRMGYPISALLRARHTRGVQLRTDRLALRPFRPEDVEEFERFARDDAYLRYLGEGHPEPTAFVARNLGRDGAWVIELDGVVVGSVFLDEELAYLIDPHVHRRGIAAEAARAVIGDGFGRRGYTEIVARADPQNVASVRVLTRLGFVAGDDGTYLLARSSGLRDT
jgi:aminoglycoside 6'-N-acetyltransferase